MPQVVIVDHSYVQSTVDFYAGEKLIATFPYAEISHHDDFSVALDGKPMPEGFPPTTVFKYQRNDRQIEFVGSGLPEGTVMLAQRQEGRDLHLVDEFSDGAVVGVIPNVKVNGVFFDTYLQANGISLQGEYPEDAVFITETNEPIIFASAE